MSVCPACLTYLHSPWLTVLIIHRELWATLTHAKRTFWVCVLTKKYFVSVKDTVFNLEVIFNGEWSLLLLHYVVTVYEVNKRLWIYVFNTTFPNRVEKYRPNSLEDLISHRDIITTSKLISLALSVEAHGRLYCSVSFVNSDYLRLFLTIICYSSYYIIGIVHFSLYSYMYEWLRKSDNCKVGVWYVNHEYTNRIGGC